MHENKQYTQAELAQIVAAGLSPEVVNLWPRIELPEAVAMVARTALAEDPDDPYVQEDLANAVRPRSGLRTPWGCIVVEFANAGSDLKVMVTVAAYLDHDPYLELQHMRRDAEVVGLFLSDVAGPILEDLASSMFAESELEWQDNGETNQLFEMVGFFQATDVGALAEAGQLLGMWLGGMDVPEVLRVCQRPDFLSSIDERSGLPLSVSACN
ncbi:hypothetical protein AEMCBJ_34560 (plasmid) [Cupriavidus necator]|uniref:hypothetical protein n=1 Tax=Cupriavidus necator TaxID=106590 RepID=UPI003F73E2CF